MKYVSFVGVAQKKIFNYSKPLSIRLPILAIVAIVSVLTITSGNVFAESMVAPNSGGTSIYQSANGVEVININRPNGAGLSHNRYTQYNVDSSGQVLNNGNFGQLSHNSKLAGPLLANPNLSIGRSAQVILNEVVSPNRSQLKGYTEVVGNKADVVVANPYGITCNGCGFVNTDQVTLTTGSPDISSNGTLNGFSVNQGDVLIDGNGLNGKHQSQFNIVTRSAKLNANIHAKDLNVTTGSNDWDYASRSVKAVRKSSGKAPSLAIDSTALGGMYANRIFVQSTEQGAGVKMLGNAAAIADDLIITADGKIEIANNVLFSNRDLELNSNNSDNRALQLKNVKTLSRNNIDFNLENGGAEIIGGKLVSGNDIKIKAKKFTDTSSVNSLKNNNRRYARGKVQVDIEEQVSIEKTTWGGKEALNLNAGKSLIINESALSSNGDISISSKGINGDSLEINDTKLNALQNLSLDAENGKAALKGGKFIAGKNISITANHLSDATTSNGEANNNKRYGKGNVTLNVANNTKINGTAWGAGNALAITSGKGVTIDRGDLSSQGDIAIKTEDTSEQSLKLNGSSLVAHKDLLLEAKKGEVILTGGKAVAGKNLTIKAKNISDNATNSGEENNNKRVGRGDVLLDAAENITINGTSWVGGDSLKINANKAIGITQGVLTTQDDLLLTSKGNSEKALMLTDSTLSAKNNIELDSQDGKASLIGGVLVSGAGTTINTNDFSDLSTNNNSIRNNNRRYSTGATILNAAGSVAIGNTSWGAGEAFTIKAEDVISLTNASISSANNSLLITTTSASTTALTLLDTQLSGRKSITINALQGRADISGGKIVAGEDLVVNLKTLSDKFTSNGNIANNNQRHSGGRFTFNVSDNASLNNTIWNSKDELTVNAGSLSVGSDGAVITSQGSVGLSTTTGDMLLNTANLQAAGNISLNSNALISVNGVIKSTTGNINVAANSSVHNSGVVTTDNGNLNIAAQVEFENTGTLHAGDALKITDKNNGMDPVVKNTGNIFSENILNVKGENLTNTGVIQAKNSSSITVAKKLDNSGTMTLATSSGGDGLLQAENIENKNTGIIQSTGHANINIASQLQNNNNISANGNLAIRGSSNNRYTVNNNGRLQSGGLLSIKDKNNGQHVNVNIEKNKIIKGGQVDIAANVINIKGDSSRGATLEGRGNTTVKVNTLTMGGSKSLINGGGNTDITVSNGFSNTGVIHSKNNLKLNIRNLINTNTGGISALNDLNILSTSTNSRVTNNGALYSGRNMNVNVKEIITNTRTGTMDSGRNISLRSRQMKNYNNINASNAITINTSYFNNDTPDGDSRTWGSYTEVKTEQVGHRGKGYLEGCCDHLEEWDYEEKSHRDQYYSRGKPKKPQIISGNNLTIAGIYRGNNTGGVLSSKNVSISGTRGSTFVNDSLDLKRERKTRRYTKQKRWAALGPVVKYDNKITSDKTTYSKSNIGGSVGAGIYAKNLSLSGFSLTNKGSSYKSNGPNSLGSPSESSSINSVPTTSFGGIDLALPSNPNGFFVSSTDPSPRFLITTNPLFLSPSSGSDLNFSADGGASIPDSRVGVVPLNSGANTNPQSTRSNSFVSSNVSSDLLVELLNHNPDQITTRIGDAAYENHLIRQQLISQVGTNLLRGNENEYEMIQGFYTSASEAANKLTLRWGEELTQSQINNLTKDIVWMVEKEVRGTKVLVPVVYLSQATKDNQATGAVIQATNASFDLEGLENTGGTIEGSNSLNIVSVGDVVNTSGVIKGGDVSITSEQGDIVSQTFFEGNGDLDEFYETTIGKTAVIESTGILNMNAANDIKIRASDVIAGLDATLEADNDILFDTFVDKSVGVKRENKSGLFSSGSKVTTTTTENHIGSSLQVRGNLSTTSGNNTTIAGSSVDVKGNLDATTTNGSFNVLARQDKKTTHSESNRGGLFVGGGLAGTENIVTDEFIGKNKGSTLTVGGNASVDSKNGDVTLQGSDVSVTGDASLNAKNINVLDGLDEKETKTTKTTQSFLSIDSDENTYKFDNENTSVTDVVAHTRSDSREIKTEGKELNLYKTTTETKEVTEKNSVASNLNIGGQLTATASDKLKVTGSNIAGDKGINITAKDVEVSAGRNEYKSTTNTETHKVGFRVESKTDLKLKGKASGSGTLMGATANGEANGKGSGTIKAGYTNEQSTKVEDRLVHNKANLNSKSGAISINAQNDANFSGADVHGETGVDVAAKNIKNTAVKDHDITTEEKSVYSVGLYIDAQGSGKATADGAAGYLGGVSAKGEAEVKAEASIGVYGSYKDSNSVVGSEKHQTNKFTSGANVTRTATNTITDQGTQIEAGGDIVQSAQSIDDQAIHDRTWSESSSGSHDGRLGIFLGGEAKVEGQVGTGQTGYEKKAEPEGGVRAKYSYTGKSNNEESTTAVVSRYKSGGSITSTTTGETKLTGAQFESTNGGDIQLNAGSLDYQAAKNTKTSSSNITVGEGSLKGDVIKKGVDARGYYSSYDKSRNETTAQAGSMSTAGNITINTTANARLEGTAIVAGSGVNITSTTGDVKIEAAKNTIEEGVTIVDVGGKFKANAKGGTDAAKLELRADYYDTNSKATTNQVANIESGSGNVNISAGKNIISEGSQLKAENGSINLTAAEGVKLLEAKDTKEDHLLDVHGEIKLSTKTVQPKFDRKKSGGPSGGAIDGSITRGAEVSVGVTVSDSATETGKATSLSANNINISGQHIELQETEMDSASSKNISGNKRQTELTNEKEDTGVTYGTGLSGKSKSVIDFF